MKINFYKKIEEEKEIILRKELPLDELNVYVDVFKKILEEEIENKKLSKKGYRLIVKFEDTFTNNEVVRDVILEYKNMMGTISAGGDIRVLGF